MNELYNLIDRLRQKEPTSKDILLLTLTGVIVLVLVLSTIRIWGATLLSLLVVLYLIISDRGQAPPQNNQIVGVVYRAMYRVISETYDRIFAKKPVDLHDLMAHPLIVTKNGVESIRLNIPKSSENTLSKEQLSIVKKVLQSQINKLIKIGALENMPYSYWDDVLPVLYVDDVYDEVIHIAIDVIFVDSFQKANYIYHKTNLKPFVPETTSLDEEF